MTWHDDHKDGLTFGERAADVMRNGMGSWGFVGGFLGFMCLWAALHGIGVLVFDPFPFILLNLFLSMLAGLQGAILLIAAKRQDAIASAMAQHDYETNLNSNALLVEVRGILLRHEEILARRPITPRDKP
jgi:uncharacterized membrane protein